MPELSKEGHNYINSGTSKVRMADAPDSSGMTKEDRRQLLLEFMVEYDLALPPRAIYRNLRYKRHITFSYSSILNYLEEFVEEGLVRRIEPEPLASRDLVDATSEKTRAYYIITEKGMEHVDGKFF